MNTTATAAQPPRQKEPRKTALFTAGWTNYFAAMPKPHPYVSIVWNRRRSDIQAIALELERLLGVRVGHSESDTITGLEFRCPSELEKIEVNTALNALRDRYAPDAIRVFDIAPLCSSG